ncbi:cation-binding hemerythrin HHE family protein [Variovorax sp. PBS-H4]|uniref:bacteriohemerythrin n=1 Tax=Variovorax sp. PBS-H4 TaxID=434008 RepID=UPI001318865C|nr:hemerythrin [Variovorax sp. PBS-H4]VTU36208.1 cation-binding hemerythrin HHE family protein [Variovorax sp. PBS-H4]
MAASAPSEALALHLPFMDDACGEFIDLLTRVDEADNARLPSAWRDLVACAAENFAREDVWMRASGHAARKDHEIQHRVVLGVMREGALQAEEGRLLQVREMARQLRGWYEKHVQTMDAALALHLRSARIELPRAARPAKATPPVWPALCEAVEYVSSH